AGPWQALLRSPASIPPASVLTTVAGVGVPTLARVVSAAALGTPTALAGGSDADISVTADSALVPGSTQYRVGSTHSNLPAHTAASGQLARWVLETGQGPVTAPVPVQPLLAGPPVPLPLPAGLGVDP